jgi:hypothetical protein
MAPLRLEVMTNNVAPEQSLAALLVPLTDAPNIKVIVCRPQDEGKVYVTEGRAWY